MTVIEQHEDECRHGIFPPSCCTACKGAPRVSVEYLFPAQFDSRLDCGHQPEIGDTIARLTDGRLTCQGCAP